MGIGSGLIYLPAVAVQAHHWKKHRALAIGLVITGMYFFSVGYNKMKNWVKVHPLAALFILLC